MRSTKRRYRGGKDGKIPPKRPDRKPRERDEARERVVEILEAYRHRSVRLDQLARAVADLLDRLSIADDRVEEIEDLLYRLKEYRS